jgi:hypothetical protein
LACGLAVVGDKVFVSHFYSEEVLSVDLRSGLVTQRVRIAKPSNPLLRSRQLASMTVSPHQDEVTMPHNEDNNDPGGFTRGATQITSTQYYVDGPSGMPAVVPAISTMDPRTDQATSDTDPPNANICPGCVGTVGGTQPTREVDKTKPRSTATVHNVFDTTTFGNAELNTPVVLAYVDGGRARLIVYRGTKNVILMCTQVLGDMDSVLVEYRVGVGNPDSKLATAENVQPPTRRSATRPVAQRLPWPNGSSKIGASTRRCGVSRRDVAYSASRL